MPEVGIPLRTYIGPYEGNDSGKYEEETTIGNSVEEILKGCGRDNFGNGGWGSDMIKGGIATMHWHIQIFHRSSLVFWFRSYFTLS